ncbi:MAG: hypothetical protein JSV88_27665 [Candidatus Aminicenantes bacterium]|nr:MAG: hypothetical protein JSV88_27665 [Candidatus Aminicenantes bacterium]
MKNMVLMLVVGMIILGMVWSTGCKTSGELLDPGEPQSSETISGTWETNKLWGENSSTFTLTFIGQQVIRKDIRYEEGDVYLNNEKVGTYSYEPKLHNHPCSGYCVRFNVLVERYESTEMDLTPGNVNMKGKFNDDQSVVEGTWSAIKL